MGIQVHLYQHVSMCMCMYYWYYYVFMCIVQVVHKMFFLALVLERTHNISCPSQRSVYRKKVILCPHALIHQKNPISSDFLQLYIYASIPLACLTSRVRVRLGARARADAMAV